MKITAIAIWITFVLPSAWANAEQQAGTSEASPSPSSKTVTPISPVANPIPVLETKGDVYKTVGPNDAEIYGTTIGDKKMIMLYAAFKEQKNREDTKGVATRMLGDGRFLDIFHRQSYGKLKITIDHVHGWREMPRPRKENDPTTTEGHRQMFVDLFALYPKVDFRGYDYVVAKMPSRGNFAFGERDDKAIPYRGGKINVGVNIGSNSPGTLAHEVAHCMGLPDLYSLGDVEGPRNPLGHWDLMSSGGRASGFIGWQRHKLGWMDAGRKTYLTRGTHLIDLTPLDAKKGISMVVVPADDPKRPSVVFVTEVGQPPRPKKDEPQWPAGVLIYRVDGTRPTGKHAVVICPREDFAEGATFLKGDAFSHDDAPFDLKVIDGLEGGGFRVKIEVKR
ncbi:MAG: hypothetical protein OEU26_02480 [Candidatus Tectomicrobia bacterium]|nr:hypothetical protein [Candidatus Tectomicrobia bacterium]